jgi:hypothetical protein
MTITRLPKPVPEDLPPARLYLDDIEEITSILRAALDETRPETKEGEKTPDTEAKFQVEDRVSAQVLDFEHLKKRTHDLKVFVSQGYRQARVTIAKSGTTWWSIGVHREKCLDTYGKLKTVFDEKKVRWRAGADAAPWWIFFIIYPAGLILAMILANRLPQLRPHSTMIASITALFLTIAWTVAVFIISLHHSTVILSYSTDARSKREDLRSKIVLLVVGSILGSALTFVTQYVLRKILH